MIDLPHSDTCFRCTTPAHGDEWWPCFDRTLLHGPQRVNRVDSLASPLAEIEKRLGPDPARWQWGQLHQAVFEHPLAARVDDAARPRLTVGAWPIGGSGATPMATGYRSTDYQLTGGASFRMVADVGNWDASVAINAPGQSGDPASPHYRDLAPLWAQGRYFPLAYSRQAVERAARIRIELRPQ
jgi:penicillin amidase